MKKNFPAILALLCVPILFSTCTKIGVQWPHGHHNPIQEGDICRITKIKQLLPGEGIPRTGNFYYSDKGNLDSVVFDLQGLVHFWKYDDQNRLIEYRDTYNHDLTQFITLHRYASVGNRIVRDTIWLAGASGYIIQVWSLEYDGKGRVIRETGIRIDQEGYGAQLPPRAYQYENDGNLHSDVGGGTYDNEINFFRTNKTLQFIHRNYSLNNLVYQVLGYNAYGLPVAHAFNSYTNFLGAGVPDDLVYSCVPIPGHGGNKTVCRFDKMKQYFNDRNYNLGTFYYTPEGRPMSVRLINAPPFFSESATHHFNYDKQGRLIQFSTTMGIAVMISHNYGYANGQIVIDTMRFDFLGPQFSQISKLYYDNIGRVIKEDVHVIERELNPVSEFSTINYQYDNKGNLVSPLVTSYDNKTSYLRTDPVWMFVNRNYSRNNPQGVVGYNNRGLPLGFSNNVLGFLVWFEPVELSYTCGENSVGAQ